MNEILFSKIQRLKEEERYLSENKPKFLSKLKESVEIKKIVERMKIWVQGIYRTPNPEPRIPHFQMNDKMNQLVNTIEKKPYILFAYLFGSQVTGSANKRSDWDIGVYFSKSPDDISRWCVFELEAECSQNVQAEVQVITLNRLTSPLFGFQIINEGILLVQRDEDERIKFEHKILRQYHDWQYFLKRQMEAEKTVYSKEQTI